MDSHASCDHFPPLLRHVTPRCLPFFPRATPRSVPCGPKSCKSCKSKWCQNTKRGTNPCFKTKQVGVQWFYNLIRIWERSLTLLDSWTGLTSWNCLIPHPVSELGRSALDQKSGRSHVLPVRWCGPLTGPATHGRRPVMPGLKVSLGETRIRSEFHGRFHDNT